MSSTIQKRPSVWHMLRYYWLDDEEFGGWLALGFWIFVILSICFLISGCFHNATLRSFAWRELKTLSWLVGALAVIGIPYLIRARREWLEVFPG